jgi:hypothetical protein
VGHLRQASTRSTVIVIFTSSQGDRFWRPRVTQSQNNLFCASIFIPLVSVPRLRRCIPWPASSILELPQQLRFVHGEASGLRLPSVDRALQDAKLRRHVHRRSFRFHLLQGPQSSSLRCVVPDMTLCDQSSDGNGVSGQPRSAGANTCFVPR